MDQAEMREWHRRQVTAFAAVRPVFETYANTLHGLLQQACRTLAPMAIVQARAKTLPSFAEKAIRKRAKYSDPLHQLTDLCGARVITETQAEVDRVCDFIRRSFIVDEANSDDKRNLLGASEFGYLSVHFIVQMPSEVAGVMIPSEIGGWKAEIQVRTLLQHAWASIAHDRLYKNEFVAPQSVTRDMNRLAAVLEGTDHAFGQMLEQLDRYAAHIGAHLKRDRLEQEIETLRLLLDQETDPELKTQLALRLARICRGAGLWLASAGVLEQFAAAGDGAALRESGHALCRLHRSEPESREYQLGLARLKAAVEKRPDDGECHAQCAWAYAAVDEARARYHAERAYRLRPSDPYNLSCHLEHEVLQSGDGLQLSLLGPALRAGAATCRAHAEAGIEVPWAHFVLARLNALTGEEGQAMDAATRAVAVCLASEEGTPPEALAEELASIRRMSERLPLRTLEWLSAIYALAASVERGNGPATGAIAGPVVILAGSCDPACARDGDTLPAVLAAAFHGFQGTIMSGGTVSGISGEAGAIAAASGGRSVAVGYHPAGETNLDRRYGRLVASGGPEWSVAQPLRMWSDLIEAGVAPRDVTLIGCGGGALSAFEYAFALALGARVALVDGDALAIRKTLNDPQWRKPGRLLRVPADAMTLRALIVPGGGCTLDPGSQERAAERAHERYLASLRRKPEDPAARAWSELPEVLRDSNRQQVRYFAGILQAAGYDLAPAAPDGEGVEDFSADEIELMAEMEHGRWNAERLLEGWRLGPRDPLRKTSPYLLRWDELTEDARQLDREAVRAFPALAAEAGLQVRRHAESRVAAL
ncbi:MAG: RyR domain-containing protein [Bryobacteraceae bacterium]|nr:RyR domain-containing protein [Bryobacteraceae bacterium]